MNDFNPKHEPTLKQVRNKLKAQNKRHQSVKEKLESAYVISGFNLFPTFNLQQSKMFKIKKIKTKKLVSP